MKQLIIIQTEQLDFVCAECGGDLTVEQDDNSIKIWPCEKCAGKEEK